MCDILFVELNRQFPPPTPLFLIVTTIKYDYISFPHHTQLHKSIRYKTNGYKKKTIETLFHIIPIILFVSFYQVFFMHNRYSTTISNQYRIVPSKNTS